MHKRSPIILGAELFFVFILISSAFCADETLTITTYYPSPYGVYNEIRLYPHSSPVTACNATTRGTMYYDSDDGQIHVCDGASWPSIGGGGGWTDDGTVVRLTTSTDNVGIGTAGPGAKLDIQTAVPAQGTYQSQWWSTNNTGYGLKLQTVWDATGIYQKFVNRFNSTDYDTMTFKSGNVGIGTTNPGAKLDVASGNYVYLTSHLIGTDQIEMGYRQSGNHYSFIDFRGDDTYTDFGLRILRGNSGANAWSELTHRGTGDFVIQTGEAAALKLRTNWADRLVITSTGNVGIGTASPQEKLDISVPAGSRPVIGFSGGSAGTRWHIGRSGSYNIFTIAQTNIADYLAIDGNTGNVGIGTTGPTQKLDVVGGLRYRAGATTIRMSGVYSNYYEFIENESSAWGVTKWASSKRFKENITDLEIDSSKIYDLNPVSFNWKPERGGQRDFGIIAEQAAEILPLLVAYDKDGKPFSVKYDLLSVLLLNELKKKAFEINALNETVEQLKTRIEKLEQRI